MSGVLIPSHPFFEKLRYELFQFSAEAIRLSLKEMAVDARCFLTRWHETRWVLPRRLAIA